MSTPLKKRLLIYYPLNKRAIGLNAVIDLLSTLDIEIFLLTQDPHGQLHIDIEEKLLPGHCVGLDIQQKTGIKFYFRHAKALARFCKANKIEVIFSHLQQANLVSLIVSVLMPRLRIIFFRHHFHYYKEFKIDSLRPGKKELIGEKLINLFARLIVVPSCTVMNGMIQHESVNPKKLKLIPYIYNFNEYPCIDTENVKQIQSKYFASLLLLMSSRFVEPKRHQLVLDVLCDLVKQKGLNINLILLDEGPLKEKMQLVVKQLGLTNHVFFIGYTRKILDYMAAADLLIHPSLAEASNSSVKEMGLAGKTAVVCRGVGDFDDYIINYENGFLINPANSELELKKIIEYAYDNQGEMMRMGTALKKTVIEKFSSNQKVLDLYKSLLN